MIFPLHPKINSLIKLALNVNKERDFVAIRRIWGDNLNVDIAASRLIICARTKQANRCGLPKMCFGEVGQDRNSLFGQAHRKGSPNEHLDLD